MAYIYGIRPKLFCDFIHILLIFFQFQEETSDYILGEYAALEREEGQIDNRAGFVEKELRKVMEKGNILFISFFSPHLKRKTYSMKSGPYYFG